MSITQRQLHNVTLVRNTITYTNEFHLFLVTFGNTNNHVVYQSTVQAVESLLLLRFNGVVCFIDGKLDLIIFNRYYDRRVNFLRHLTLWSFYRHYIILQGNCYTCRDVNRQFTYS